MDKCSICGTEQKRIGTVTIRINNEKDGITAPHYNINLFAFIMGKHICDTCMDIYNKIYALKSGMDFSSGGVQYYADGRNLE